MILKLKKEETGRYLRQMWGAYKKGMQLSYRHPECPDDTYLILSINEEYITLISDELLNSLSLKMKEGILSKDEKTSNLYTLLCTKEKYFSRGFDR